MSKKILIVGGVAGGATAAARMRRLDESAEIIMFERGEYISFANCGLPYYIGETIKEREALLVQTPEAMNSKFNIDVRVNSDVIGIDTEKKTLKVNSSERGTYEESYDYVILSPGAKPIAPPIKGIDSSRIYKLRNVPDTDQIKAVVDSKKVSSAVVIGGGFIGIETAENLRERGVKVTLVEAAPHILAPFDTEMAVIAEKELNDNGVSLILGNGVKGFVETENKISVELNDGQNLETDMVILSIGVLPDTGFLKESGINLGERGHILVNDSMQTSVEGVYAVGDAIMVKDYLHKTDVAIPLAGPANRQGRIAADNIAGLGRIYKGSLGTSILKIFDMAAASTGNNERNLQRMGKEYKILYIHPMSHASYYPGAMQLTIKVIYSPEGKVLGAQAIGYDGVDKFIDVIATSMKFGATIEDLEELELAYAPPYLSAKSPANMAGFVADNDLNGKCQLITPKEFENFDPETQIRLDVRDEIEIEGGSVPGAINIPLDFLRSRFAELDKNKEIIVFCAVGLRGYIAARMLIQKGYKVRNLVGGTKMYDMGKYQARRLNDDEMGEECLDCKIGLDEFQPQYSGEGNTVEVDACGICCPGPLMKAKKTIDEIEIGDIMKIKASDPGFYEDIKAFAKRTGNELVEAHKEGGFVYATVRKGLQSPPVSSQSAVTPVNGGPLANPKDGKTIIVFSGDLDKAIASFIIANGALAMGKPVTMFFTFWGLNVLRKNEKVDVPKNFIEKAFGMMMPRGSKKLQLSKMNMAGMGAKMIRMVMKDKNVESLEDLIKLAIENGANIVACTMSMDVMGIKEEELIDGVNLGGVGYYLGEAEDSNVNLFI
ncbi:DsrE/DsrF/DrsH-like family protein [Proteocatella sphenisci]|uniref:DsrE/DsrF/DrsH-like family protein n=1 Tax=Proteocatella sphenisci TaxID=181070 RepID=UPI00048ECBE8|nr:DsrE/DsrF/DrsH-like family protein [Proteocatella sphenisci]